VSPFPLFEERLCWHLVRGQFALYLDPDLLSQDLDETKEFRELALHLVYLTPIFPNTALKPFSFLVQPPLQGLHPLVQSRNLAGLGEEEPDHVRYGDLPLARQPEELSPVLLVNAYVSCAAHFA